MTTQAKINHIRFLVGSDDLATALNELQQFLKDRPQLDEAIQQSVRYNSVLKRIRLGLTDFEAADLTTNQIRKGILDLLNEIEREQDKLNDKEAERAHAVQLIEETYEYQKIKDKIFINRGAGTSELLKDKQASDLDEKELSRLYEMDRVIRLFDEQEFHLADLTPQKRLVFLSLAENGHIFKGTFLCLGKRNQIQTISHFRLWTHFARFSLVSNMKK